MSASSRYKFQRVTPADFGRLAAWQSRPHVRAWWDAAEPFSAQKLQDLRVSRWIVSIAERPFAYLQDYTVHGWDNHHFSALPKGSRGIDQFIGEPDMIGKGHGPAFIAQRLQDLFTAGAPVVATDPHPENARAISAYEKAGFTVFGPVQETPWGPILPMQASP
ncbi:GNAT family N-acetyltransferase [Rhizobium halophytocola]|uniref:Aminoglycoside 6'-N-acetyltransferase n=1 Tax=Rhizobium halophytocola TaxID=735519 RepID=A0ABS4DWQ0_9HYPH|nr:GNAT family N-acetyltransferase [Rhizobium halophytocola]MBP1850125.1 aminoglycoside 6'-N-acetyltransferase [Rhizobium halophytocola]